MLQQPPFSPTAAAPVSPDGSLPFSNLDPLTAKQMAALQATSIAKAGNRSAPGGMTSASYFGGLSTHQSSRPDSSPSADPSGHYSLSSMQPHGPLSNSQPTPVMQQQAYQQRKRSFLHGLGNVLLQRGAPLPPQLTGVAYPPGYDPSTSPWRTLEFSNTDIGVVRLANKDVDLFKLWGLVQQAGGSAKISEAGMWAQVLPPFDLPEQFIQPNGQAQSTAVALRHYYNSIIGPFEEAYRKNVAREQQQRALQARAAQGGMPMPGGGQGRPGLPGTFPPVGTLPAMNGNNNSGMMGQSASGNALQPPDASSLGGINGVQFSGSQGLPQAQQSSQLPQNNLGGLPDVRPLGSVDGSGMPMATADSSGSVSDLDGDGRKRKMDEVEENGKRVRQRTGESSDLRSATTPTGANVQTTSTMNPTRARQPSRRKISYIPLAREVDTAGGWDLDFIQQEFAHASQRPIKDPGEWGTVDVEALTMSIRSRISTELSYALTIFTLLTLPRVSGIAFPITQAPDLFEEVLDLVEEIAFGEQGDDYADDHPDTPIIPHRHIVNTLMEESTSPFASLKPKQGVRDPSAGPQQRPGGIILMVTNIFRNLSLTPENHDYMGRHDRLMGVMLRLCALRRPAVGSPLSPLCKELSLNDLMTVRRDTVFTLINIANTVHLSSTPSTPSAVQLRTARRTYDLLASYLIDPTEAISPYAWVHLMGASTQPPQLHNQKPPTIIDSALEVFTRVSHTDDNRLVLCKAIPPEWLWSTVEALVHRLPLENTDFQVIMRAEWLAYLERVMMSIYSIAFFAPPSIKKRVKTDRQLSFTKVMLRLIKRLSVYAPVEARPHFVVTVRRAVEALGLIDDAGDLFDSSSVAMPTLTFGMGYGEHGESRVEKGMGLLSGYQEEITWGLMTQRDVDEQTFSELVSLVRVEPAA